jgi:folylpolyglutamate synthase/dihydropteroate synthase
MATSWNEMTAEIDTNGHLIPKIQVLPSIASAMDAVKQDCDGVVDVMITGSLYLVGAALEYMKYPTESKR